MDGSVKKKKNRKEKYRNVENSSKRENLVAFNINICIFTSCDVSDRTKEGQYELVCVASSIEHCERLMNEKTWNIVKKEMREGERERRK